MERYVHVYIQHIQYWVCETFSFSITDFQSRSSATRSLCRKRIIIVLVYTYCVCVVLYFSCRPKQKKTVHFELRFSRSCQINIYYFFLITQIYSYKHDNDHFTVFSLLGLIRRKKKFATVPARIRTLAQFCVHRKRLGYNCNDRATIK